MLGPCCRWLLRWAVRTLALLVWPLTWALSLRKAGRHTLPPPINPLLFHPATHLAHMIRTRAVRCEDVIKAYVERCREVNPYLNAVVEDRYEEALREAREVDRELAAPDCLAPHLLEARRPLLGLPLTVKESLAVRGMSNSAGCGGGMRRAQHDAEAVGRARAAGAIVLAVTNTPQLCMNWETYNKVTGLTRNPHCLKRTVGGSSGGEAALLGAAGSLLGLGSDVGGSLRLPAAFTGVYAHKPTPRLVSTVGHVPSSPDPNWEEYFAVGPMARYAEDLPLLLRVVARPEVPLPPLGVAGSTDLASLRYLYLEYDGSLVGDPPSRHVTAALKRYREHIQHAFGKQVLPLKVPALKHAFEASAHVLLNVPGVQHAFASGAGAPGAGWRALAELPRLALGCSPHNFTAVAYSLLHGLATSMPRARHDRATKVLQHIADEIADQLGEDGVLVCPVYADVAHVHYRVFYKFLNVSYLMVWNALGLPATSCPVLWTSKGLPVGLQLVTLRNRDHLSLALAAHLQRHLTSWRPPNSSQAPMTATA